MKERDLAGFDGAQTAVHKFSVINVAASSSAVVSGGRILMATERSPAKCGDTGC